MTDSDHIGRFAAAERIAAAERRGDLVDMIDRAML